MLKQCLIITRKKQNKLLINVQLKVFENDLVVNREDLDMILSGKRVELLCRTVFDIDPNLAIHQVGVPMECKNQLTFPENVNEDNLEHWKKEVNEGRVNLVIRGQSNTI